MVFSVEGHKVYKHRVSRHLGGQRSGAVKYMPVWESLLNVKETSIDKRGIWGIMKLSYYG